MQSPNARQSERSFIEDIYLCARLLQTSVNLKYAYTIIMCTQTWNPDFIFLTQSKISSTAGK